MAAAALIGDQLILEEDYDENYTPSEPEIHEYAREIGIDPDREPDLLWLAREGIVAPLPREWKPCQDVTGDVYYFNFSTGQSTWDHPCDEHYRGVVTQERQRAQLAGPGAAGAGSAGKKETKEKKKKKEKKEKMVKRKKEPLMTPGPLSSALGPPPSTLGSLAPLRGLDALGPGPIPSANPPLRGSHGGTPSSGGLEPLKTSLGALRSSGGSSVLGSRQERGSMSVLVREDQDDPDAGETNSGNQSACGSAGLLRNLYLDLDALGGGLQYEDSEASGGPPPEERTEPELQDLALSRDHSPEPPSQQESVASEQMEDVPSSMEDLKSGYLSKMSEKPLEPKDRSPAVSPLDTDLGDKEEDDEEEEEEEEGEREPSVRRNSTGRRPVQAAAAVERSPARQVDRLVLHQSSTEHSLSSPEPSGRDAGLRPRAEGLSSSLGLQRPETSRGRLARAPNARQREQESPTREQGGPPAEELSWKTRRTLSGEGERDEEEEEEVAIGKLRKKEQQEDERRKMEVEERDEEDKGRERRNEERAMERRNLEREVEEEKRRGSLEKERRLRLLREELRREEEEEERRLKKESEERVRAVCERLDSERSKEEARLREESDRKLKELRESGQRETEHQQHTLREESGATVQGLRVTLDEELAAERDRLEARKRKDSENLRMELETELQAERQRLLGEKEEKLSSLRQEIKSTERRKELRSIRPEQQLTEYRRELADVLQEVREEVQRDHNRKLEQLKEEHRRELSAIREQHLDQEATQREHLLCALQDERERLQSTHTVQLEKLRLQLETQTQKTWLAHTRKESELQDQLEQLELKTKDLKTQEALLQTKEADLKRRRKRLGEEEEEVDRGMKEREQLTEELGRAREERRRAQQGAEAARGERDAAREEFRRAQEDRERLEHKVEALQERCARLGGRVSELEQGEGAGVSSTPPPRLEKKKAEGRAEKVDDPPPAHAPSGVGNRSLHMGDLEEPPLFPVPDSQSSLQDMRRYISTEEASLHEARRFLERESRRLAERQAALQAAGPGPYARHHSLDAAGQEPGHVEQLRRAVQQGSTLLRRKEEQLQQLESSLAEEPLLDELSRMAGERKVAFDVTDSDLSSTLDPHDGPGGHPTVPAKVQQLAESLQQISGQLNLVLGALGSLAPPSACSQGSGGLPPTSSAPLSAGPPWAWGGNHPGAAPLFASSMSATQRAPADLLSSRWAKLFPGAPLDPVASSTLRTTSTYSSFTPASVPELDGQRLQGLIDGNKRWLEMRRKDASIPLFTRYRPPSTGGAGLVQLGLDDNNQIKVYHY
ncbi:centrosomal protein of 164 kDa-like isoform X1 [Gadus macrocephalus]|uniref:centrosomal protein of 164 kDa-like isoform X1 n=1 Tax=Gadus macrocephalus TaxID=80720 RepID=UPI0028CB9A73|nr:centrosomal protein of 164 kDa-like isoform X1 [Gadus macrocephalus]